MKIEDLEACRNEILWWEICSLLHDVGKLSDYFLRYRSTWHTMEDGYSKSDPHEHDWLEKDDLLRLPDFAALREFFQNEIKLPHQEISGRLSVINAVHNHIDPHDDLARLLKLGDAADSKYDRNNPLIGNEQTEHAKGQAPAEWYRSNVYGYEGPRMRIAPGVLDAARREFYEKLQAELSPFAGKASALGNSIDPYRRIRLLMKEYFEPAMSDTTRPNNDTSLWEHVYSVATITKALHVQRIWGEEVKEAKFHLLGVGFDRLRFASYGHKIGDVLGRNKVVDAAFDAMEEVLEFEIPLGNRVYRDDNFLVFLVPAIAEFPIGAIRARILQAAIGASEGEMVPHVAHSKEPLCWTTRIVEIIQDLKNVIAVPVPDATGIAAKFKGWNGASVCSVCRLRGSTRNAKDNRKVCSVCRGRRQHHTENLGTRLLAEIADEHGRVALLVAKFGLREWLDGRMVRTNFITEPNGIKKTIEALRYTKELADRSGEWEKWYEGVKLQTSEAMCEALVTCQEGKHEVDKAVAFFGRHIVEVDGKVGLNTETKRARETWTDAEKQAQREHRFLGKPITKEVLLDLVCAKTPTPSTIYDVWETTEEFLKGITIGRERFASGPGAVIVKDAPLLEILGDGLAARKRLHIESAELRAALDTDDNSIDVTVGGRACEAVLDDGSVTKFWLIGRGLNGLAGKPWALEADGLDRPIEVVPAETAEPVYRPYRQISCSPDALMLLVPAAEAPAITEAIYSRYLDEFGKAYGRLPFSIGNIFFPEHLPMFSVLDAAWRMVRNFERLHEGPWLEAKLDEGLVNRLPSRLGNCEEDHFHPYVRLVNSAAAGPEDFVTLLGPVARFSKLRGRGARIRPNFYDCVLLGASADRFKIPLGPTAQGWRWRDNPEGQTSVDAPGLAHGCEREAHDGPIRMEQFQGMRRLWQDLKIGHVADASIRNFEHLLLSRIEAWSATNPADAAATVRELAQSLTAHYFDERDREAILKATDDGTLYRTLDLHLRILKERLSPKGKDDNRTTNAATV